MRIHNFTKTVQAILMMTAIGSLGACGNKEVGLLATRVENLTSGPVHDQNTIILTGTYSSCASHMDGSSWNVGLGMFSGMVSDPLSVVAGDISCQLHITQVVMQHMITSAQTTFTASPPTGLLITGNYLASGIAFSHSSAVGTDFFANARMTPADYSGNFILEVAVTDDPKTPPIITYPGGSSSVSTSMISVSRVAAPDYATTVPVDFMTGGFTVVGPPNQIVDAFGSVFLTASTQTGEMYTIVDQILPAHALPTGDKRNYDDVELTFNTSMNIFPASNPMEIQASDFNLNGAMVPLGGVPRFVIVLHVDGITHLKTYEVIELRFYPL